MNRNGTDSQPEIPNAYWKKRENQEERIENEQEDSN